MAEKLEIDMLHMMTGFWNTQIVGAVVYFNLPDLLQSGPKDIEELTRECSAQNQSLYRLMRGSASLGILTEVEKGKFGLNPAAELLQNGRPMREAARWHSGEGYFAWSKLTEWTQTNNPALGEAIIFKPPLPEELIAKELAKITRGYQDTQMLKTVVELGIADLLRDSPVTIQALAEMCGAQTEPLDWLLHRLSSGGVFNEVEKGKFGLNSKAELLRTDISNTMSWLALLYGSREQYNVWGDPDYGFTYSVRTGQPGFNKKYGMGFFAHLSLNPEINNIFNNAMATLTRQVSEAVATTYDFSGMTKVVDVGGGHGQLIEAILKPYPKLQGVLFDLNHVTEGAKAFLDMAGIASRCEVVSGDFFEKVPGGGDCYLFSRILHDWDDEACKTILGNCRKGMLSDGRLLAVEMVIPEGNGPNFAKLRDLQMLTIHDGCERTKGEFDHLFTSVGFKLTRVISTTAGVSIIEAIPN